MAIGHLIPEVLCGVAFRLLRGRAPVPSRYWLWAAAWPSFCMMDLRGASEPVTASSGHLDPLC